MGHNFGIIDNPQNLGEKYDWNCGPKGTVMGGNARPQWSPCGVMQFRYKRNDNYATQFQMSKKNVLS